MGQNMILAGYITLKVFVMAWGEGDQHFLSSLTPEFSKSPNYIPLLKN